MGGLCANAGLSRRSDNAGGRKGNAVFCALPGNGEGRVTRLASCSRVIFNEFKKSKIWQKDRPFQDWKFAGSGLPLMCEMKPELTAMGAR
jgi:hypothetical protein